MASKMAEKHAMFLKMHTLVEFDKFYMNFNKDYILTKFSVFYKAFYCEK